MDSSTVGALGLVVLIAGAIIMLVFSVSVMSGDSRRIADLNRQHNQPISNGYARLAVILVVIIFVLTVVLGLVPPLVRRG